MPLRKTKGHFYYKTYIMSVSSNLIEIKKTLPQNVTLVAVSKTHPNEKILEAYQCNQRVFGENKVQELIQKQQTLPSDVQWHLIGHLQTNKVKQIIPFVSLIHGIDSEKLLLEIQKEASKINKKVDCLLQMHIAQEESKFGMDISELDEIFKKKLHKELSHVKICGLMGMATFTDNEKTIRNEFKNLKNTFDNLIKVYSLSSDFKEISMGMSGDYKIAIEEGSTVVRIGSSIFGNR